MQQNSASMDANATHEARAAAQRKFLKEHKNATQKSSVSSDQSYPTQRETPASALQYNAQVIRSSKPGHMNYLENHLRAIQGLRENYGAIRARGARPAAADSKTPTCATSTADTSEDAQSARLEKRRSNGRGLCSPLSQSSNGRSGEPRVTVATHPENALSGVRRKSFGQCWSTFQGHDDKINVTHRGRHHQQKDAIREQDDPVRTGWAQDADATAATSPETKLDSIRYHRNEGHVHHHVETSPEAARPVREWATRVAPCLETDLSAAHSSPSTVPLESPRSPPGNIFATDTPKHGFLSLPGEIRNQIYDEVIGPVRHKYEIKTPQSRNPRYVEPFDWSDAYARLRVGGKRCPSADIIDAFVAKLNAEREADGRALETLEDPNSLTAWRYRRVRDLSQEDLARMSGAEVRRAPLWLLDDQKLTWGHFEAGSTVQAERFRPVHLAPASTLLRREIDGKAAATAATAARPAPSADKRRSLEKRPRGAALLPTGRGARHGPAALGLTCRQVAAEFLGMLYSRAEFSFSATRPTFLFFWRLAHGAGTALPCTASSLFPPPPSWTSAIATCVTSLSLHHFAEVEGEAAWQYLGPAGLSEWRRDNAQRERDWAASCAVAAAACVNLATLDVTVDVREPARVCRGGLLPRLPAGPAGIWDGDYADPDAMERAAWFQPLKVFRGCRRLESVTVTYQPCPRTYSCVWGRRRTLEAVFSRLLKVGPSALRAEYDLGRFDAFLAAIGHASWQRWPTFGPLTWEEAEAEGQA